MGQPGRNAAVDIEESVAVLHPELSTTAHTYNFYQLVELIQKSRMLNADSEEWERYCQLVFGANTSLGFARADVVSFELLENNRMTLQTNFFGLSGAQSPLPGFITEQLVNEEFDGLKQPFFNFFNNRLINLIYRIWRKYRYYVRFQPDAQDKFSSQLFALVGLGDVELRGETPINWCKMLAYSGMLAGRNRSPQVIAGVLAHCFDLQNVQIRQWVKRKVKIDESQRLSLGMNSSCLGVDTVIGDSVMDCKGKFAIRIEQLSRERFTDFLPLGKEFKSLCKLVELMLRDQLAFDLELVLDDDEYHDFSISRSHGTALGWTSFLGCQEREKQVLIQVRQ